MAATTIASMTLDELRKLIADAVEEAMDKRLTRLLGACEIEEKSLLDDEAIDTRSVEEILDSIDRNMWTPPTGAKSSQELLRQDRVS